MHKSNIDLRKLYHALVLADLGAEVIHIEPINGDHTRRLKGFGTGYFTYFNRNKKSLAVNLKTEEGHAIIRKMLAEADVLIENFAPKTMDGLGLGYAALKADFPRLIYCSLKGFLKGPYEQRPALDEVVQMMSGLAYMTGPVGQPLRAGASVVDIMGGTYGAMAVLVALMERQTTGRGKLVQNGLFETAAYIMGQHMAYSAISQEVIRVVESARGPAIKLPNMGGGLPLTSIERPLGTRTIVIPMGNHDNNQHSYNENLRLQNLWDGIELMAALLTM